MAAGELAKQQGEELLFLVDEVVFKMFQNFENFLTKPFLIKQPQLKPNGVRTILKVYKSVEVLQ